ncbi:MAG TPA: prephenate dehydrogenase/arogenate dehydrogenase family protein [Candidatus Binataceae bacterium]|nr:prephenate dehydrogenase/arogenate dehydrogenase family protein [Candidatus Binataceae bacterium]
MAPLFRQLTLCGVGLIGGSLALIARRKGLVERIVGLGRTQANLDVALERGIIDFATRDPQKAARDANLVMLATPIRTFPETLAAMVPYLPKDAVVTDVGSVKTWVVRELEPLLGPQMVFVGVHPVAGKEITGAIAADEQLYIDRRVIVTPSSRSTPESVDKIEALWCATGARLERMAPEVHDALLARSSHLPQIASSALAAALADEMVDGRWAASFGAGGLRDTTRIAASSPEMWRDICLTNREAITAALKLFATSFTEFAEAVDTADEKRLMELFARGRKMREQLK